VLPSAGLFWFWEAAIGTNPKISRPSRIHRLASGGFEWERRRSGVIHLGFGTFWRGPEERWAGERGLLYGHLHVHLLFPTLVIETLNGKSITVIDNGRLTAMDDPEIRAVASEFGDPDKLLREDWSAPIPGISAPGSYDEYAANPAKVDLRPLKTFSMKPISGPGSNDDKKISILSLVLTGNFCAWATEPAFAQEPFYKGKTIRIIVGFGAGGGFDAYARSLSRHMGKHISGNPTLIVENMTGAGSLVAASHLYKVARPDGLTIGTFHGSQVVAQLIGGQGIEFDARKLEWIGTPGRTMMFAS
jgi:hypothetical protein